MPFLAQSVSLSEVDVISTISAIKQMDIDHMDFWPYSTLTDE
jgi:hypothetical protein